MKSAVRNSSSNDLVKKKRKQVRFLIPEDHVRKDNRDGRRRGLKPLEVAIRAQIRGTRQMFISNYALPVPTIEDAQALKLKFKIYLEYQEEMTMASRQEAELVAATPAEPPAKKAKKNKKPNVPLNNIQLTEQHKINLLEDESEKITAAIEKIPLTKQQQGSNSTALALVDKTRNAQIAQRRKRLRAPKPTWHPPWKLFKVISGHTGWVRSIAVDVSNEWFATGGGAADRTIKIWDLASGTLKLTLTGHISDVRGLAISPKHPLLFSCGTDKTVRCWDLEQNKVIRKYHGHLSGVYAIALHPTLPILFSGGRDSSCRVWDIRTKVQIHVLTGHKHTVQSIISQATDPEVATGSHDHMIRLWDLRTGKTTVCLTNHKKAIRGLVFSPTQNTFASGAADNIKVWKCPNGNFLRNMSEEPKSVVNCLAANREGVLISGHDDGVLSFWDWNSGYKFQSYKAPPQPGSLESECGIQAMSFDRSGCRLITGETDKTIKIWKEDENATQESHPIRFRPPKRHRF